MVAMPITPALGRLNGEIAELKDSLGYSELDTNLDYKVRETPISRNKQTMKHICRLHL